MKKLTFLLCFMFLLFAFNVGNSQTVQIGTGTTTTSYLPIYGLYGYSYSQQIYTKAQINTTGTITKIRFYFSSGATTANSIDWVVYMGHTTKTDFISTTDWIPSAGLTQVFNGVVTYPVAGNWMEITLSTPFVYNNTDNLVIAVDENTANYDGSIYWNSFTSGANTGMYYRNDLTNPDPAAPPTASSRTATLSQVQLYFLESCPQPNALTASNFTTSSAQLGWTNGGTETEWYIIYGTPGFDPLTEGTLINTGVTNPYVLSGLTSATTYQFYVKAVCGVGDESAWAGPYTFATLCTAFSSPFTQGFESATAPPVCWTMAYANATPPAGNLMTHSTDIAYAGTMSFRFSSFSTGAPYNQYLISPELSYTQGMQVTFQYRSSDPYEEVFSFGTSTTGNNYTTDFTWGTDIIDASDTEWKEFTAIIPAGTKYVAIQYKSDYMYYLYIDEFSIQVPPVCNVPTAFSVSNITTSAADLSWTAPLSGTPTGYEWLVVAQGDGTTGTPVATGTTTHPTVTANATGLTSSTPYDAYVRTFCGGSDYSVWVGPVNFTTSCLAVSTFPFSEGFEGGTIPACWSQEYVSGTEDWTYVATNGDATITPRTGATMAEFRTAAYGDITKLITPPLDITSLTVPELTFYYANTNWAGDIDELRIFYKTSASGTWTQIGDNYITEHTTWTEVKLLLPNPSSTYYVAFEGTSNWARGMDLDDITIKQGPTCTPPTGLAVSNITATGTDMSWVAPAAGTPLNYEWLIVAQGAGSGGAAVASGSTAHPTVTATASGLTSATSYDLFVRTDCGGGDFSDWAGPLSFTTLCNSATVPYSQNFETATPPAIPLCTSVENAGTGNLWTVYNNPGYGFTSNTLRYSYHVTNNANAWFYTQAITLNSGTSYRITFKYGNNSTTYTEKLKVAYGPSSTYTAMTNVLLDFPSINQSTPQDASFDFTPATTGEYYFGFNAYSDADQFSLYVDDIVIDLTPSCPEPSALNSSNITSTSAQLGWTNGGTETEWYIVYGAPGFNPATEGTLINTGVTNPYTLTGLTAATTYSFYVKAICGVGDESLWAGPYTFTTGCDVFNAPFSENFDGIALGAIPVCWSRIKIHTSVSAVVGAESSNSPYTTPYHLRIYNSWTADAAAKLMLITPELSNISSNQIRFYAKASTANEPLIIGTMTDPTDPATFTPFQTISNLTTTHTEYTVKFDTYLGTNTYIAFSHGNPGAGTGRSIFIDNFVYEIIPTCFNPTNIVLSNITTNSVDISWTAPTQGTPVNYEWIIVNLGDGPTGTPVDQGLVAHPATTDAGTGLSPSTTYELWMRTDCGSGDYSSGVGPIIFSTQCAPFSIPFTETFNNTTIPLCWSQTYGGTLTSNRWSVNLGNDAGGTPNEMMASYQTGIGISRLITPALNTTGQTNLLLQFETMFDDYDIGATIKIQSSPDGTTWTDEGAAYPSGSGDIPAGTILNVPILNNLGGTTYIAWVIDGDHFQFDYWYVDSVVIKVPNTEAEILTFDIPTQVSSTINSTNATVNVVMPFGTDPTNLVPTFTLSTGATAKVNTVLQQSGVTSNDYTSPVVYNVRAENLTFVKNWTVTVTVEAGSSDAEILTFDIPTQISSTITSATATVDVVMPYGTDRSSLTPTITISGNATIDPLSGIAQDFTNPFIYTVTAQDATTKDWTVNVTNELNNEAEILTFSFAEETGPAIINSVAGTVTIEVSNGTNLAFLVPTITVSLDATIDPASGIGQDFTSPFVYTVTAQDGTIKTWTVTVTEEIVALVFWNFPNNPDDAIADGGIPANLAKTITTVGGTGAVAFNVLGISTYAATANGWDNGMDTKYWEVEFTTTGYNNIRVSSVQKSSATGPTHFKLQYQVGAGPWTDLVPLITVLNDSFISGAVNDQALPSDANNQASVKLRWIMADNTSVGGGTVAGTGTSRMDNLIVNGDLINAEAEILAYTIPSQVGTTTINSGAATVNVDMLYGTDVTALVSSFVLSAGASAEITGVPQVSGTTPNDFTTSLVYTVTAEDGTTTKDWTVTVTVLPPSSEAEFLTYSLPGQVSSVINSGPATIAVVMPYGSDITNLIADFTLSLGANAEIASVPQVSGVTANDFSGTIVYTVTAQDAITTKDWTVTVTVLLNDSAEILAFDVPSQVSSTINSGAATVDIVMPFGTDITALVPAISISTGATINPASGVAQDFTNPVVYTVTAENGTTTKDWTVTVTFEDYIDLALVSPPSGNHQFCDGTATQAIEITIENVGNTVIASGEQIDVTANIDGNIVNETITLTSDMNPGETLDYTFTATFDVSAYQVYNFTFSLSYTPDMDITNNSTTGTSEHIMFSVEIANGDVVSVLSTDFPYSLSLTDTYDAYEWTDGIGNVISTNATADITAFGTYYISVHMSQTNCWATDSILITDAGTDLTILIPAGGNIEFCDGTAATVIQVLISNVGTSVIAAGEQIEMTATIDATTYVETLTLTSDMNPNDDLAYSFIGTFDLSAYIGYNYTFSLSYAFDANTTNDTVTGIATHILFTTEITQGDTLCLQAGDFPYTLTLTGVADNYEWTDSVHNVISSSSTAIVNDFGWYYIEMWNTTQTCWVEDSIIVFLCVDANSTSGENPVSVYPNPSNGMVYISSSNPVAYEVTTMEGKAIRRNISSESFNAIDFSNEAKGVYFIKVISNNATTVHKVVIE